MKVYKLRDVKTGNFVNKKYSKSDRLYQDRRVAAAAATHLAGEQWSWSTDRDWYRISREERKAYRESLMEIVEFDCVEVTNNEA